MRPLTDDHAGMALLGVGPLVVVSAGALDALALGGAACVALLAGNVIFAAVQRFVVAELRLAFFVLLLATLVAALEMEMHAALPGLHAGVRPYFALVVLAGVVLGRGGPATSPAAAAREGLWTGLCTLAVLLVIASLREALGQGTLFAGAGDRLHLPMLERDLGHRGWLPMRLPTGAFVLLALGLAFASRWKARRP